MGSEDEIRRRRDAALKAWRREVERFRELLKSPTPNPAAIENQKKAIGDARSSYDSLNEEYLNSIERARTPGPKAPDRIAR
jgi:Spy/CpxP family protein refolding chaperone